MNEKQCCRCKEIKPLDLFNKSKNRKDGHTSACKECRNNPYNRVKCKKCKRKLEEKDFYKNHAICKDCYNKKTNRKRKHLGKPCTKCGKPRNTKSHTHWCNECFGAHKKENATYVWSALKARAGNDFANKREFLDVYFGTDKCELCGVEVDDNDRRKSERGRQIDRIDSNGSYNKDNCRVVCRRCNIARAHINALCLPQYDKGNHYEIKWSDGTHIIIPKSAMLPT